MFEVKTNSAQIEKELTARMEKIEKEASAMRGFQRKMDRVQDKKKEKPEAPPEEVMDEVMGTNPKSLVDKELSAILKGAR
jgi:hypothetical protein